MSDTVLDRLRHLMKIVDPADGHDDGRVDKSKAMKYINALSAQVAGKCPEEHAFLKQIAEAVQAIKGESFSSAEGPSLIIEPLLRRKLQETTRGRALLDVKQVPAQCDGVNYELQPDHTPHQPTHAHTKKGKH